MPYYAPVICNHSSQPRDRAGDTHRANVQCFSPSSSAFRFNMQVKEHIHISGLLLHCPCSVGENSRDLIDEGKHGGGTHRLPSYPKRGYVLPTRV